MRLRLGVLIVIVVVATLSLAACGGHSLQGTTWRGNGLVTGNVKLTFVNDTDCQFGIGAVGATGTYSVAGDQVTVRVLQRTYVFTIADDSMTGHSYGMALTLSKE